MVLKRTLPMIALAAAMALSPAVAAYAASHAAPKTGEKKATEKAAAKGGRHVGTVKAVDAAAGTLTVTETSGDQTVTVTEKTSIKRGKEALKLSDIKEGDEVTVRYLKEDAKDVGQSITVKAK